MCNYFIYNCLCSSNAVDKKINKRMQCMQLCLGIEDPPDNSCHNLICKDGLYKDWKRCELACRE